MSQPATATAPTNVESVSVTTTSGGLRRLNPADGLFLRAEHLQQMQLYAQALSRAGGVAGGTGVVHGFGLTLDGATLTVGPGLAMDPTGRPLASTGAVTIALDTLTVDPKRFWVVEVLAADPVPADTEPVYGTLCADACAAGTIHPWLDEAVRIQVSPDDGLPELGSMSPDRQRNWLASHYFERERRDGHPWLTPGHTGKVASVLGLPWSAPQPGAAPLPRGVPIGVLLQVEDTWVLDVWMARRDLIATPSHEAWHERLGLRPWGVFIAEVLQFQTHQAALPGTVWGVDVGVPGAEEFFERVLKDPPRSKRAVKEAWQQWREEYPAPVTDGWLWHHGVGELPPAGVLPEPTGQGDLQARVEAVFGSHVAVYLRHGSADQALRAVTEGQHLDRIPLHESESTPEVDVWVPDVRADLQVVQTDTYGWIAFVRRRREARPPIPLDTVEVFTLALERVPEPEQLAREVVAGKASDVTRLTTLSYPAAEWAVPADDAAHGEIAARVDDWRQNKLRPFLMIGTAMDATRRPLALARAGLLAAELQTDDPGPGLLPTLVSVAPEPERIVVVVRGENFE